MLSPVIQAEGVHKLNNEYIFKMSYIGNDDLSKFPVLWIRIRIRTTHENIGLNRGKWCKL